MSGGSDNGSPNAPRPRAAKFELIEPPLLSRAEIDRANLVRKDPDQLAAGWATARVLDVDHRGGYAVDADGALRWRAATDLGAQPVAGAVFLGRAGTDMWALRVDEVAEPVADPRTGAHRLSSDEAGVLATALGLLNWQRTAQYSPVDGRRLDAAEGGWVRLDPDTGAEEYPRTDPAVIMVVHDGADQVLLGRQTVWPDGWYSTLAGFVEPGESLEQCVRREVFEEAGIRVHSPRYLGSQPWPFPRSLMLGFEAVGDPSAPIELADGELGDAKWFHRDEVLTAIERSDDWGAENPAGRLMLPASISIARSLITSWAHAGR